jgi:uncharacterized membrane protein
MATAATLTVAVWAQPALGACGSWQRIPRAPAVHADVTTISLLAWQFVVVLAAVLVAVALLVQIGILKCVSGELGIPSTAALGLLVGSLVGSAVNIPVVASMGSSNAPAVRRVRASTA